MLYDEFVQGTGCRETEHNYKVYKDVEVIYMNSDMTKEEAYTIGKMRVNNSLTEDEEERLKVLKADIVRYEQYIADSNNYYYYGTWEQVLGQHKQREQDIKDYKAEIKQIKEEIKEIKSRAK